jgi:hypothetical protein
MGLVNMPVEKYPLSNPKNVCFLSFIIFLIVLYTF